MFVQYIIYCIFYSNSTVVLVLSFYLQYCAVLYMYTYTHDELCIYIIYQYIPLLWCPPHHTIQYFCIFIYKKEKPQDKNIKTLTSLSFPSPTVYYTHVHIYINLHSPLLQLVYMYITYKYIFAYSQFLSSQSNIG
jgi:hypothetical protein